MSKNVQYKARQYELACKELCVLPNYTDSGPTLTEAICELKEKLKTTDDLQQIMSCCNLLRMYGTLVTVDCKNFDEAKKLFDILEGKHVLGLDSHKFAKSITLRRKL